jgi:beta-1,4-mannosyl-glycoprotein beta-1,4-N-acetylglucosaminyltransferase
VTWDAFTFFNELDVLDIRLYELNPVVDRFVLVEGTRTFSGKPKPLYFDQHRSDFKRYLSKITHVVVDDLPGEHVVDRWQRETQQRNAITRGLSCEPSDILMISDVDEIPEREAVRALAEMCDRPIGLLQRLYYYWLNCEFGDWLGTTMLPADLLTTPQAIREQRGTIARTSHVGWHFSFLGDVIHKIESFSHHEVDLPRYKDPETVDENRRMGYDPFGRELYGVFREIDASWPIAVRRHRTRYSHLIGTQHGLQPN